LRVLYRRARRVAYSGSTTRRDRHILGVLSLEHEEVELMSDIDKGTQELISWGIMWFLICLGIGTCNYLAAEAKWTGQHLPRRNGYTNCEPALTRAGSR
jgi:hypothetical protein